MCRRKRQLMQTCASERYNQQDGPQEVPHIQSLDSAFQMAEYLQLLVQDDSHNIERLIQVPDTSRSEDVTSPSRKGREGSSSSGSSIADREADLVSCMPILVICLSSVMVFLSFLTDQI